MAGYHYIHGQNTLPTREWILKHISYEPISGVFTWNHNNKIAGRNTGRYREICIAGVIYRASKLAWLIMTNEWPIMLIDHKNRISGDDSWDNLRLATNTQNQANKDTYANMFGYKGVSRSKNRYKAEIRINGHKTYLGSFDTIEEAATAYNIKAKELYGEFAI